MSGFIVNEKGFTQRAWEHRNEKPSPNIELCPYCHEESYSCEHSGVEYCNDCGCIEDIGSITIHEEDE